MEATSCLHLRFTEGRLQHPQKITNPFVVVRALGARLKGIPDAENGPNPGALTPWSKFSDVTHTGRPCGRVNTLTRTTQPAPVLQLRFIHILSFLERRTCDAASTTRALRQSGVAPGKLSRFSSGGANAGALDAGEWTRHSVPSRV